MNFGEALRALKEGKKVAREVWRTSGSFLWLEKGLYCFKNPDGNSDINEGGLIHGIPEHLYDNIDSVTGTMLPCVQVNFRKNILPEVWCFDGPSILAEDWLIIE